MTLYVGDTEVTEKSLASAWNSAAEKRVGLKSHESNGKSILWLWSHDKAELRYKDYDELAAALQDAVTGSRKNYYFEQEGENKNIAEVIHTSTVPQSSIGWTETEFFKSLGHSGNSRWLTDNVPSQSLARMMKSESLKLSRRWIEQGLRRRAEQEYLLQNMVKGAMFEAAEIANKYELGIAVRGTGLLAHMGIESGDPTKAQEFKNKTSKEIDLWLCDELEWTDLGAVVHYDPRVGWTSQKAAMHAKTSKPPMYQAEADNSDWEKKLVHIENVRKPQLAKLEKRIDQNPNVEALKKQFLKRSNEYMAEDYDYRKGHFAPHTVLVGPFIRLKLRPNANMVGDHDLFAFTKKDDYGEFAPAKAPGVATVQTALQQANTFQAQHGGIWYWEPKQAFHVKIKTVIMGGHSPNGDEPLVYIQPGYRVTAAYYIPENDKLMSVWEGEGWTKWLETTHSGKLLLNPPLN